MDYDWVQGTRIMIGFYKVHGLWLGSTRYTDYDWVL